MKRNLKAFGLTLVAAFALSAVTAVAAQATQAEFTAEDYPAAITGEQEGGANYFELTPGLQVTCATATYEGTLTEGTTQITVHPHYTGCEDPIGLGVTVDLNHCHYLFKVGAATSTSDVHGSMDIVCPANQKIETTIGGINFCRVDIPPQSISVGVTYTNIDADAGTPRDYVTVDVNINEKIRYTDTDISLFCPFAGNSTAEDASFFSSIRVKGYEDKGTHAGTTTLTPTNTEGALLDIDVKATG